MTRNLLSELAKYELEGMGWVCRQSTTGRGIRLYQSPSEQNSLTYPTPEAAIEAFIASNPVKAERYNGPCMRIKREFDGTAYPWPNEREPNRTIELYHDDVITQIDNGTWTKHTGLGCFNIQVPQEHVERWPYEPQLMLV